MFGIKAKEEPESLGRRNTAKPNLLGIVSKILRPRIEESPSSPVRPLSSDELKVLKAYRLGLERTRFVEVLRLHRNAMR